MKLLSGLKIAFQKSFVMYFASQRVYKLIHHLLCQCRFVPVGKRKALKNKKAKFPVIIKSKFNHQASGGGRNMTDLNIKVN